MCKPQSNVEMISEEGRTYTSEVKLKFVSADFISTEHGIIVAVVIASTAKGLRIGVAEHG